MKSDHPAPSGWIRQTRRVVPVLIASIGLVWIGCVDQTTDPGADNKAFLAMAAALPAGASNQASFIDAWRVVVSRPGEGIIAEQSGPVGPEQESVSVEISVTLDEFCEMLSIRVELSAVGEVWFRTEGTHQVCSGRANEIQTQELQFVRPQPTVSPGALNLTVQERQASSGSFTISYQGVDGLSWMAWVEEGNVDWLAIQPGSGSVTQGQPQDVTVLVDAAELSTGQYVANLVVVGEGFPTPIGRVAVNLTVTPAPRIGLSTTSLTFSIDEGSNPPAQSFTITNVGGGELSWGATDNVAWLSLSPTAGSLGSSQAQVVTVTVNTAGLNPGSYLAAITVSDPAATNSPRTIAADLTVTEDPAIGLSATALSFSTRQGSNPPAQQLTVSNTGGGLLNWQASDNTTWLSVSPFSGTLPAGPGQRLTATVSSASLSPGTYSGAITVSDPEASNSPRIVSVNLTVLPPVAPTISDLVVTLLQLNDTTCGNEGSRFEFQFNYADPDGDLPTTAGSFSGTPIGLNWRFRPEGHTGSAPTTASVTGTSFSGTATFQRCIAYQVAENTSVDISFTLQDSGARASNLLSTNIPRPMEANSPPHHNPSRTRGEVSVPIGGTPF